MKYQKNNAMDFIPADETSLAVFDHESGDTHLLDERGIDIVNLLGEPQDIQSLLSGLAEIYDAAPDDMQEEVAAFLTQMVEKRIVLALAHED